MAEPLSPEYRASVLAVDDEPAVLSSIRRVLRRSMIDVRVATDGAAALKQLGPWFPELLLLDVSMPGMSGQAFLRRFRQVESRFQRVDGRRLAPVPVMFVSARSGHRQRLDGLNAGAVDYLTKPFDPEELRARVCSHIRHHRRVQDAILAADPNRAAAVSGAPA
ncbi:MAG: response regulator [Planctomycetota bacterium]